MSETESTQTGGDSGWDHLARTAAGREGAEEAGLLREFVTFSVNDDPYALPIERVREIVRLRPVTPVPRVPEAVIGVISLRGEIVQVVDLRRRLAMPTREPSRTSRIIVLHGEDGAVTGLLVDSVRNVLRITDEDIRPGSAADAEAVAALLVRGQEFVSLLDIDRVMDLGE